MDTLQHAVSEVFDLINEMSPYLLLGFLLAGLMHSFVPGSIYSRYLSGGDIKSVLYAALFGIPLPLCSCGVIPTAMSLRREGASKGAAVSFLIATPQTGIDSIIATFSLMGLPFAIVRPIAALITAVFGGQMVNIANRNEPVAQDVQHEADSHHHHSSCHDNKQHNLISKIKEALSYAFLEMMEDIGRWLVVGLVVAGLITVLVPDSFFAIFKDNTMLSMLLVLCIAIPMYICATGSIPIAVALMMKGLTPGAALVLLMAGPACNMASILVINKVLGRRTLLTYLASIIIGSILFGVGIDMLLPRSWFVPSMMNGGDCCHHDDSSWFSIGCTILLLVLLINALWQRYHGHSHCHCHDNGCHCHDENEHATCSCTDCHCHDHSDEAASPAFTFVIKGMSCNHCRNNAIKALESLPNITHAEVDLASGHASIQGTATVDEIANTLSCIGFEAVFE